MTSNKIKKADDNAHDYRSIHVANRELMDRFVDWATVAKVDEAKRQIAEALGVDVEEHVIVNVEMKFIVIL